MVRSDVGTGSPGLLVFVGGSDTDADDGAVTLEELWVSTLRRLIVTLLEEWGAAGELDELLWQGCGGGVLGGADAESRAMVSSGRLSMLRVERDVFEETSIDLTGEPDCEVRRRFLAVRLPSSKGLGRVAVTGSAERARSQGSCDDCMGALTSMRLQRATWALAWCRLAPVAIIHSSVPERNRCE